MNIFVSRKWHIFYRVSLLYISIYETQIILALSLSQKKTSNFSLSYLRLICQELTNRELVIWVLAPAS